jgi:transcriptional regulator with XRE-family HTH domain
MCQHKNQIKSPDDFTCISEYLAYIRGTRGYSLQNVVDLVAIAITQKLLPEKGSLTRSYISSLEAGKYAKPSPFKLQSLAHVYHIPCELLMQKAEYLKKADGKWQQDSLLTLLINEVQEMTQEELQSILEYIDFMKSKQKKYCVKCIHNMSSSVS